MELGIDVLHITKTHDSRENFSTPYDTWSCHSSEEGNKSQGAATFTRIATEGASSNTNVSQVKVLWESEAMWLITAYFPNDLPGTINTTRAVDTILQQKLEPGSSWQETLTPQRPLTGPPLVAS